MCELRLEVDANVHHLRTPHSLWSLFDIFLFFSFYNLELIPLLTYSTGRLYNMRWDYSLEFFGNK